ncbi:MAG: hypothetical protein Kow0075_10670 [Salibacteraceae bacterium]
MRGEQTDFRSDSIDILYTGLQCDLTDLQNQWLRVHARLAMKALVPGVKRVSLDLLGFTVDSVYGAGVQHYVKNDSQLIITLSTALSPTFPDTLHIKYQGKPQKDATGWGGFYFSGLFAWNLGVGFAADPHSFGRAWFPCFDNFIERSLFGFEIKTNSGLRAACNGTLLNEFTDTAGFNHYHWSLEHPIPSYLACVAVGPYVLVNDTIDLQSQQILSQIHARASDTTKLKKSFRHLPQAVEAFVNAYGPYRFEKVGYSLVPFTGGAMEHATNITYPLNAVDGTLSGEDLMTHELAHMWWGDNTTCRTDDEMWLNEGWASFSEYLAREFIYGKSSYEEAMLVDLRHMLQFGHHREEGYRPVAGQPHHLVYGDHVYKKGALVANNLRTYMGDEAFFQACKLFMEKCSFKPVTSDSLQKYFELSSQLDLSNFFRDWVFSGGYNAIVLDSFSATSAGNMYSVSMFLHQKLKGAQDFHNNVPVVAGLIDENGNMQTVRFEMSGEYDEVVITTSFDPELIVLYPNHELANARTMDKLSIHSDTNASLKNSFWSISTTGVDRNFNLYIEQYWVPPDPVKPFGSKPFRLSGSRYWRVSSYPDVSGSISAQFFYDGRTSLNNAGFLDIDLVNDTEDSLILLYRPSSAHQWEEYESYSKDVLGIPNNAYGLIKLSTVLPGEYTLANIDHSVLSDEQTNGLSKKFTVYPNPATGELIVENESPSPADISILDHSGRLVMSGVLHPGTNVLKVSQLVSGTYSYVIKFKGGAESGSVVISR